MAVLSRPCPMAVLSRPCPRAVLSRPWQFYQGRSSQMAKHPKFHITPERAQWLFCPGQVQWPFYQGLCSFIQAEAAKLPHLDLSRGLQVPEHPAQSVYQRPGQAIFSKGRPNSRFIKAMSNGRCIKAFAVLSRQKQLSGQTSRLEPWIASSILARAISLISIRAKPPKASPMAVLSKPP